MVDLFGLLDLPLVFYLLAVFVLSIISACVFLLLFNKLVMPLISRTETKLDDLLFEHLQRPLTVFFIVVGMYLGIKAADPFFSALGRPLDDLFVFALIAASSFALTRASDAVMRWYSTELKPDSRLGKKLSAGKDIFPMARKLVKLAIYVAAGIIILDRLGVEIAPLIAGLGIAGLAVALALQDTLKQFFAGIYLLADKPIKSGDLVSLDDEKSTMRGEVREIGWRMTRIRHYNGYDFLVPNDKVAQSVIINYSRGIPQKSVVVNVSVAYDSDIDKVVNVLKKACSAVVGRRPELDRAFEPIIRASGFQDSGVEMLVILKAKNFNDQFDASSDLRREILSQFRKNKIEIPFPVREIRQKR